MSGAAGSARPAGNVPKGSAYGLVAIGILTGLIPFLVLQSLVPARPNGVDVWISSILPDLGAGAIASAIVVTGLYRRQFWYLWFIFAYGSFVLCLFGLGVCLGLAFLLGVIADAVPNLWFIHVVNAVLWLMISPLACLLARTLRLKYWQPWSKEGEWEPPEVLGGPKTLLGVLISRSKSAS